MCELSIFFFKFAHVFLYFFFFSLWAGFTNCSISYKLHFSLFCINALISWVCVDFSSIAKSHKFSNTSKFLPAWNSFPWQCHWPSSFSLSQIKTSTPNCPGTTCTLSKNRTSQYWILPTALSTQMGAFF